MIPSTAYLKFWPDGAAKVDASLRLTGDSQIQCCIYHDRPPILAVTDAHVSVSVSVPGPGAVTPADLAIARRLADAVTRYADELARHIPELPASQETAA
jgi:hypothetical protein